MSHKHVGLLLSYMSIFGLDNDFLSDFFYSTEMAEDKYLMKHKRLPGSNKTKRLRKKREKIVREWFFRSIN